VRKPPSIASGLLRLFGPLDEGAVGDLREEFESGKSCAWYWRQVAGVVWAALVREIRVHPIALVVCVVIGSFVSWEVAPAVVRFTIDAAFRSYTRRYFAHEGVLPPLFWPVNWIFNFAINFGANALGGFAAVRFYRGYRPLMVFSFATIVACQHIALVVTVYDAAAVPPHYVFDPVLPLNVAVLVVPPMGALVGGMFGARRQATAAA
jgi:hypothetical protein